MIKEKIFKYLYEKRSTFLGVGPMSKNCIDATIELSNLYEIPVFLIASRRQIDAEEFGGGYVNNWNTREFSDYVLENDKKGKIILSRDHGGPWQNPLEQKNNLSLKKAMESAKKSYLEDIKSGFQVLHIDPSIDIHGTPSLDEVLDRIFELYEYCWRESQNLQKDITFEIGTEEQSGSTNTLDELEYTLERINVFCNKYQLPTPTFVVVQCGTRVAELRNVGSFDSPVRIANEIPTEIQLPRILKICKKYKIFMKEHNGDYLSSETLAWHPRLKIPAVNVAPEFGVAESKALVELLEYEDLKQFRDEFIKISLNSLKWKKWMLKDTKASDLEKAIIAGHYIFSSQDFKELRKKIIDALNKKDINLDEFLKEKIKKSISRYLVNFNLIKK
tara:strand:+ start:14770 stop:15936 length:1167 start_codon:yes stop_codon:yes gene_type:complete